MQPRPRFIPTAAYILSLQSAEMKAAAAEPTQTGSASTSPLSLHANGSKPPKKQVIHTLGTGMTSTWSHYNRRDRHTERG